MTKATRARQMPTQCPHGCITDWGDFGVEDALPEPCYYCRRGAAREEVRDLVYRALVNRAREDESLKAVLESLGFFRFLDVVDAAADSIQDAYEAGTPLADVYRDAK